MECEFGAAKVPSSERKAVSINSHRLEASHYVCAHCSCAIFCGVSNLGETYSYVGDGKDHPILIHRSVMHHAYRSLSHSV